LDSVVAARAASARRTILSFSESAVATLARVTDADPAHPSCPSCGYDRSGIPLASVCPECGAEGLDGAFVLAGAPRLGRGVMYALLGFLGLGLGLALVGIALRIGNPTTVVVGGAVRPNYRNPPPRLDDLLFIAALGLPFIATAWSLWKSRLVPVKRSILWTFHSKGVEIRTATSREFIRREEIVRIGAANTFFVTMSQLVLVRRHAKLGRISTGSRILYLHGTREERDARIGAARRWLEDPRRAPAE